MTTRPADPPTPPGLPAGFGLVLDRSTLRLGGGGVLVGGVPLRILRLSGAGRRRLDALADGQRVPADDPATAGLARRLTSAGLAHPLPPPDPPSLSVSVVVPVRDDPVGLGRLLASPGWSSPGLPAGGPTGAGSVLGPSVVVDDGSRDPAGLAAVVAARASGCRIVRHDQPAGPAAARSTGLAATTTDLVAFVDADVTLSAGWLAPLVAHFADPALAAIGPRVAAAEAPPDRPPARARRSLAAYDQVRSPLDLGRQPSVVRPASRVPFLPSAVLVCRRAALDAVGGFDPALAVGEDVDLVWRLHEAGWLVRYEPSVVVHHAVRPTPAAWLRQRFTYGTSASVLARRHPGALAPVRTHPSTAALWLGAASGHLLLGTVAGVLPGRRLADHLGGGRAGYLTALRLLARGHLSGAEGLARAGRREWWPATVCALAWRRSRPAALASLLAFPMVAWICERPAMPLGRFVALHLADDLAYGSGVWWGCVRGRTAAPLLGTLGSPRRREPPAGTAARIPSARRPSGAASGGWACWRTPARGRTHEV